MLPRKLLLPAWARWDLRGSQNPPVHPQWKRAVCKPGCTRPLLLLPTPGNSYSLGRGCVSVSCWAWEPWSWTTVTERHWLSTGKGLAFKAVPATVKGCLPLRGFARHLIHWQPGREGDSSDYPILQGCRVSRVQGCLHCAMLTLRTEAKNSPAIPPLEYPSPGVCPLLSLVLLSSSGTRRRIQTNPTWGWGIRVAPPPNIKCTKEGRGHLCGG